MRDDLFIAHPIDGGFTWTLASRLGHILRTAEARFGPRDKNYTILGVEFTLEAQPQIWYPRSCENIVIQLTTNCMNDMNQAVYQLSHEAIHCLSPSGGNNANVLEEGMATLFAVEYSLMNMGTYFEVSSPKYKEAMTLFSQLNTIDYDIIKRIRTLKPAISQIKAADLIEANSLVPLHLATQLTHKF